MTTRAKYILAATSESSVLPASAEGVSKPIQIEMPLRHLRP